MIMKKFNSGKNGFVALTAMILCFLISLSLSSCHKESPQSEPQEVTDNGKESEPSSGVKRIDFEAAKSSSSQGVQIEIDKDSTKFWYLGDFDTSGIGKGFFGDPDLISDDNIGEIIIPDPEVTPSTENEAGIYGGYFFIPIDGVVYRYSFERGLFDNSVYTTEYLKDALIYEGTEDTLFEDTKEWQFFTVCDDPEHRYLIGTTINGDSLLKYAPPLGVSEDEIEAVKRNGFVVSRGMEPPYARELMDEFLKKSEAGEPASVRIAKAYDLSGNLSSELKKATKQDYPGLFLTELSFDGNTYTVSPINRIDDDYILAERKGIDSSKKTWKYLKRLTDVPRGESALYKSAERYVLVNDDSITWDDLINGMISSRMEDYIPFEEVITIYDEE